MSRITRGLSGVLAVLLMCGMAWEDSADARPRSSPRAYKGRATLEKVLGVPKAVHASRKAVRAGKYHKAKNSTFESTGDSE